MLFISGLPPFSIKPPRRSNDARNSRDTLMPTIRRMFSAFLNVCLATLVELIIYFTVIKTWAYFLVPASALFGILLYYLYRQCTKKRRYRRWLDNFLGFATEIPPPAAEAELERCGVRHEKGKVGQAWKSGIDKVKRQHKHIQEAETYSQQ